MNFKGECSANKHYNLNAAKSSFLITNYVKVVGQGLSCVNFVFYKFVDQLDSYRVICSGLAQM